MSECFEQNLSKTAFVAVNAWLKRFWNGMECGGRDFFGINKKRLFNQPTDKNLLIPLTYKIPLNTDPRNMHLFNIF